MNVNHVIDILICAQPFEDDKIDILRDVLTSTTQASAMLCGTRGGSAKSSDGIPLMPV